MHVWHSDESDGTVAYNVHQGQARVLNSRARFVAAIAGTGGGKTVVGPLWIAQRIGELADAGRRDIMGLIVAPTYQIMDRATAPTIVQTFQTTTLRGRYSPHQKRYYLPGKLGALWLLSADNPDGLEGGQFDFAWIDEAGQISSQAWVAIQARVGAKRAPVLMTTTPYRLNWLKTEVVDRHQKNDPDYDVVTWSSVDNPAYPREEYERAKRTLPYSVFRMRHDGVFAAQEGIIFDSFNFEYNVRPCAYDPAATLLVSCDFNVNPMCWVICQRRGDHGETLEIIDEIFLRNTNTAATVDVLTRRYLDHTGGFQFYGDPAGQARKTSATASDYVQIANDETLRQLGRTLHISRAAPRIQDRFASTNARLCNAADERHVFIAPQCENLIRDLETRYYKEGSRDPADSGDSGHMTDALGYIIHRLWPLHISGPTVKRPQMVAVSIPA